VLTGLEFNGRADAQHSTPAPERIRGGRVCKAVVDPLSERASTNIALLYGGILTQAPMRGWSAPQQAWSS